ncbi:MAG: hypothetical protein IJD61_02115 [Clostridia bacterium]|nr:hypothetical protein [Clostridia bacterium]
MERKTRKIKLISIAAVCAALLLAAFGLFGRGRSDVVLLDYTQTDEGILIKAGVSSSAGYIRSMRAKELDGDVLAEFYSTFGINNPRGAKSEFLLRLSPECERILFRRGKDNFRTVLVKNGEGGWNLNEENISVTE